MKSKAKGFLNILPPILIVLVGIFLVTTMNATIEHKRTAEAQSKAELNAKMYSGLLTADIDKAINITNAIEQEVTIENGKLRSFETVAENMMDDFVQSIQIAPKGVVTQIYPAKDNEAGLGDLIHLKDERGEAARFARDNDVVVMQGPFELAQGGYGIAVRNPIYLENDGEKSFWGFSIVLIRVPDIFNDTVGSLADLGYNYKLTKAEVPNSSEYVEVCSSGELLEDALAYDFEAGDCAWRLELSPVDGWFKMSSLAMTTGVNMAFYISLAVIVYLVMSRSRRKEEQKRALLANDVQRLEDERAFNRQVQLYAVAMGVEYPLAIDVDFLGNRYQMIEHSGFMSQKLPDEGSVDELVSAGASAVPDKEQAQKFAELFNKDAVIAAFKSGQKEVTLRHTQLDDEGATHWMETRAICTECTGDAIRGMLLSKCIDNEVRNEQLRIEAQEANAAKTRFLMRMGHDVRTPLNGIIGMISMAEESEDDKLKQRECREKAKQSAHVLLELINEVLDMSKLETGEVVLEHVPFGVEDIAKSNFAAIEGMLAGTQIKIVRDAYEVPHPRLVGSPVHLKRIVMNILTNAIKFNKDDGQIHLSLKETPREDGKVDLEFVCRDTGYGMSPEFLEHVFEPFAQEGTSARTQYGGTGLGMAISKNLVERMGGTITAQSVEGEGSVFTVVIPLEVAEQPAVDADAAQESDEALPSLEGLTVLVVEDNELNMEIAKHMVESAGVRTIMATNGQEAVEAFAASEPDSIDAVLMDVMMPVMDGHTACREIRAMQRPDAKTVPVIAMTANAFAEDRIAATEAGMDEHMAKPLDARSLVKVIVMCVNIAKGK